MTFNPMTDLWIAGNFNLKAHNIQEAIELSINRPLFILIYTIDPDLLIYGISTKIREHKMFEFVDADTLEDQVGAAVHEIFKNTFITDFELKKFLGYYKEQIKGRLVNSPAQRAQDSIKMGW